MAEHPYMPFYWDAYLADTTHLTTLEHGAYFLLLGAMWRAGGTLPLDDKLLIRIAKLDPRQWHRIKPTIMRFMHPIAGGIFTQDKLAYSFEAVRMKRGKASDSARVRWLKKNGLPDALALRTQSERNAYQNQRESFLLVQSSTPAEKQEVCEMKEASKEASKDEEIVVSDALAAKYTGKHIPIPQPETVNEDGEIVVTSGLAAKYTNGGGDAV